MDKESKTRAISPRERATNVDNMVIEHLNYVEMKTRGEIKIIG